MCYNGLPANLYLRWFCEQAAQNFRSILEFILNKSILFVCLLGLDLSQGATVTNAAGLGTKRGEDLIEPTIQISPSFMCLGIPKNSRTLVSCISCDKLNIFYKVTKAFYLRFSLLSAIKVYQQFVLLISIFLSHKMKSVLFN